MLSRTASGVPGLFDEVLLSGSFSLDEPGIDYCSLRN